MDGRRNLVVENRDEMNGGFDGTSFQFSPLTISQMQHS